MKIGILREGKVPPDNRTPLTPVQCKEVMEKFPGVEVVVHSSDVRCFKDHDYQIKNIPVREDLSDCDVLLGVKEVPVHELIGGKIYFFFSHTIKQQEYNRNLLKSIIYKKIQLVDYETLTDDEGTRIIGFGRYAGLVGAYNGIRALVLRYSGSKLKPAFQCSGLTEMLDQLNKIKLPPVKIIFTGDGRVALGVQEVLEFMKLKKLTPEQFLNTGVHADPVYTQLLPHHYVKRQDGKEFSFSHFVANPESYENAFLPYARSADMLIASAYWDPSAPVLFTTDDMRGEDFRIKIIADITCDIEGSIPSTKRASSIGEPFYDYDPVSEKVVQPFSGERYVTVMAVDNLPNELPSNASEMFGRSLIDTVFPALFSADTNGIIERATITTNGKLTERYHWLANFVASD